MADDTTPDVPEDAAPETPEGAGEATVATEVFEAVEIEEEMQRSADCVIKPLR